MGKADLRRHCINPNNKLLDEEELFREESNQSRRPSQRDAHG
jgi:hypothetical protein